MDKARETHVSSFDYGTLLFTEWVSLGRLITVSLRISDPED